MKKYFLFLLFCCLTLAGQEKNIDNQPEMLIEINSKKEIKLNGASVEVKNLQKKLSGKEKVLIRVSKKVPYQSLVEILDKLKKIGITNIKISSLSLN